MASGGARPGAGRPRKDPALKALAGTLRPDRVPVPIGDAQSAPMSAPMHLSDHEQLIFGSIAQLLGEQGRANPHHSEHVGLLAVRLAQVQRLKAVLEMEGDTFVTKGGMVRARPEVAMLDSALRHAQSFIAELMLNPSAALRLGSGDKPAASEFEGF